MQPHSRLRGLKLHVQSKSTMWMTRTTWPALSDTQLSGCHLAETSVVRRVRARSPATSDQRQRHSCPLKPKNCEAHSCTKQDHVDDDVGADADDDGGDASVFRPAERLYSHSENHHQSDTTARTSRDGPVLSTPPEPTNAASLVHPRVKFLGALLACALRVVRVFTGHAVARNRPANSLIMECRDPLSP